MSAAKWIDCMPEDGVERFTERSDKRRKLFESAAQRLPGTAELPPLVWAFLQVGSLEQVEECTANKFSWASVQDKPETNYGKRAKDAVLLWKQRPMASDLGKTDITSASAKRTFSEAFSSNSPSLPLRTQAATPTSQTRTTSGKPLGGPEYSPLRDRKSAERCKKRDHGLCVVSGAGAVDACHIYPRCASGGKDQARVASFWNIVGMFWSQDKVDSWYGKVFQDERGDEPKGTETVENMLTLTSTLRRFHSEGAFALRPVRMTEDKTQLELEFHWLVRQERDSKATVDLLEEPPPSRDRKDSGVGYLFYRFDTTGETPLVSGTRFTMTTDDPTNKPLPDPGLLELQWHLQRILAMSGAAGWKEEEFGHNNEPGTGVVALPTVEQWLDEQLSRRRHSRSSSPGELVEDMDDT